MELGRTFTFLSRIDCSTCIATFCRYIKTCRLRSETSVQPLCLLTHWLLGLQASRLLCTSVLCLLTHWLLGLQLRRVIPSDTQAFAVVLCWSLAPDLTVVTSRACWLVSRFVLARPDIRLNSPSDQQTSILGCAQVDFIFTLIHITPLAVVSGLCFL